MDTESKYDNKEKWRIIMNKSETRNIIVSCVESKRHRKVYKVEYTMEGIRKLIEKREQYRTDWLNEKANLGLAQLANQR